MSRIIKNFFIIGLSTLIFLSLIPGMAITSRVETNIPSSSGGGPLIADRFGAASSHLKLWDPSIMEGELQAMSQAGIKWVRCDFAWWDLEPLEGVWYFVGADLAVEKAEENGVEVLGILGSAPSWANGGNDWRYPPTDIDTWRNYVRTVASRYRGRVSAWEIWNEQNIHAFWMPEPDSAYYVQLLQAASEEIRAVDSDVTIVMGGVAGLGSDYLDECLAAGAAEYIDAIAYHPYPETIGVEGEPEEDRYKPKEVLCRYLADDFVPWLVSLYSDKELEIWLTELGWTTCEESPPGVDYDTQASYMLRSLINYASTDVDRVIWYNLRDEEGNPQDYLGLLENDFTPKPSYAYYDSFIDVFGEAVAPSPDAVISSCGQPDTLESHCFRLQDGNLALAAWKSDDGSDSLSFTVSDPHYQDLLLVDPLTGERGPVPGLSRDSNGKAVVSGLPIGKRPVLIELKAETEAGTDLYFAEGYTGEGFQEYLCLANADDVDAQVAVTFFFSDGTAQEVPVHVPRGYRTTLHVNEIVGEGRSVSARVASEQKVIAERPMYFTYGDGWKGGHVSTGAREARTECFFAEGYTGAGFDEWICVLNPGGDPADLTFRFQTEEEGEKIIGGLSVPPRSRSSFKVNDLLGRDYQASCVLESDQPIVAERPMYFDYSGTGGHHWQGGHCVMGATSPDSRFYFAEGTTRAGFEEWLTIQNPHAYDINVQAVYQFGPDQGEPVSRTYNVESGRRYTILVSNEVGLEKDVSVELSSASTFLAERPMYFDYMGTGSHHWQGGHCVIGATYPANQWFFAEGYTGEGFEEWLCLQNTQGHACSVEITYNTQEEGPLPARTVTVPPGTRVTLLVNDHAGIGYQLSCRVQVVSGPGVVAERPIYFNYAGLDGGHDEVGYIP
jgi:hypothetical protein